MRTSVAALSCVAHLYCRIATITHSSAMPVKTVMRNIDDSRTPTLSVVLLLTLGEDRIRIHIRSVGLLCFQNHDTSKEILRSCLHKYSLVVKYSERPEILKLACFPGGIGGDRCLTASVASPALSELLLAPQLLQSLLGILVLWIQLERLLVILNRQLLPPCRRVRFTQTVPHVRRLRILLHIPLKQPDRLIGLAVAQEIVSHRVQHKLRRRWLRRARALELVASLEHRIRPAQFCGQQELFIRAPLLDVFPAVLFCDAAQQFARHQDSVIRIGHDRGALPGVGVHDQQRLKSFIGAVVPKFARPILLKEKAQPS